MDNKDYLNIAYIVLICITILTALIIGRNFGYNAGVKQATDYYEELMDSPFFGYEQKRIIPGEKPKDIIILNIDLPEIECKIK